MRNCLIFLFLALSLAGCHREKSERKYIPEEDMVNLLVEIHITDAIAMNHDINKNFRNFDSTLLYSGVLDRHGYSQEQMQNTLEYYSYRPEKFIKLYNKVFTILSKQNDEAKGNYSSIHNSRTNQVWRSQKSRFSIFGDSLSYPDPFDIEIDTTGTFVLTVEVKINMRDQSVNPTIEAYFYDPEDSVSDSRIYLAQQPLMKSDHKRPREYAFVKEMKDSRFSRMLITIPKVENTDTLFHKGIEIRNLRVALKDPSKGGSKNAEMPK
jgi:hypothetical protein